MLNKKRIFYLSALLSAILLTLIISGCRTTKVEKEIILPPKPQREILEDPKDLQETAELLNYYEHKLEEWENWGERVEKLIDPEN